MLHKVVLAALVREDTILLARRAGSRLWYPNCWDLIGGHIETGETPESALIRECTEELGTTVLEYQLSEYSINESELSAQAFIVTNWSNEPTNMAPEEHDLLAWFTAPEIPALYLAHPSYADWLPTLVRPGS